MKCNKFRENIVLDLYGELDNKEKAELEQHISSCAECAKDYLFIIRIYNFSPLLFSKLVLDYSPHGCHLFHDL